MDEALRIDRKKWQRFTETVNRKTLSQRDKIMKDSPDLGDLFEVIRGKFLILSVAVVFSASGLAFYEEVFSVQNTFLALISVVLMHIAVNSLNSASDYRTGIDSETEKTPFSGGIDTLVKERITYRKALITGFITLGLSMSILAYFAFIFESGLIIGLALAGTTTAIGYTDFFARNYMGEISAGLGLGSIAFFTVFYVQKGVFTANSILLSGIMFIPVFNLLLMNEFPDKEVDKRHGRKNIPMLIGKKNSILLHSLINTVLLVSIVLSSLYSILPIYVLYTALPVLICLKTAYRLKKQNYRVTVEEMKWNTIAVNLIFIILGLSMYLAKFL